MIRRTLVCLLSAISGKFSELKGSTLYILVSGDYEENRLLNRLFGKFRLSFGDELSCLLNGDEAKKLFVESPEKVPIEE